MIYGANGYSAQLIAERAKDRGLAPILAGRNADKTREVAEKLGFEWRDFALDNAEAVAKGLAGIEAVIHCAGPFSATSAPMIEGCLAAKAHYFDITGEMRVFEHAHSEQINAAAKAAGIVVCPGVGFDVVPTDCIARTLAEVLPDATELALGFQGDTNLSPGTAKTMIEGLGYGTWARRDGALVSIPLDVREIDYGKGAKQSMSISWGDISTAYYTTGIGHITVYWPASDKLIKKVRRADRIRPLLKNRWVQNFLKNQVDKKVHGPSEEKRAERDVLIWGEVRNANGKTVTARMTTANGYTVTALAPVEIIEYLLANDVIAGSTTPAQLMGKDFAGRLPGSSGITLS
jgi:short subunit dehydrogenase-like uncharacterized protein